MQMQDRHRRRDEETKGRANSGKVSRLIRRSWAS